VNALPTAGAAKDKPEPFTIRCPDGRELSAQWFAAPSRRAGLMVSSATGFPQTFYFKLAALRGRARYTTRWSTTIAAWARRRPRISPPKQTRTERLGPVRHAPPRSRPPRCARRDSPVATFGHSIGGQFLGLLKNHALARAHVQIATSVGYWRWEHAHSSTSHGGSGGCMGLAMLALRDTSRLAVAGPDWPLPRGVYEEWRRWCLRPGHFGPRPGHLSIGQRVL
jgi:predicted alpha/beta hydrolase